MILNRFWDVRLNCVYLFEIWAQLSPSDTQTWKDTFKTSNLSKDQKFGCTNPRASTDWNSLRLLHWLHISEKKNYNTDGKNVQANWNVGQQANKVFTATYNTLKHPKNLNALSINIKYLNTNVIIKKNISNLIKLI